MQEQQYEGFSSESEIVYDRQGTQNIWGEGEKLRPELHRRKKKGRVSPLAISIIVIALFFAVVLLAGMFLYPVSVHNASGASSAGQNTIQQAVPAPMQKP